MRFYLLVLAVAVAGIAASTALAKQPLRNDPRRPVAAIAADLDVTPDQFVACFWNVSPAPQGMHPTGARERSNKAILLPCLQAANPAISNDRLDAVMDRYRPES